MKLQVIVPTLWFAVCVGAPIRGESEPVAPGRARANLARPIVLAPDDVRAFPDTPAGFDSPCKDAPRGRVEVFEHAVPKRLPQIQPVSSESDSDSVTTQ